MSENKIKYGKAKGWKILKKGWETVVALKYNYKVTDSIQQEVRTSVHQKCGRNDAI